MRRLYRRILSRLRRSYDQLRGGITLRAEGVVTRGRVVMLGVPIIQAHAPGSIVLGNNVVLCSRSDDTALGVAHPVVLRTLDEGATIAIGDDFGMSGGAICAVMSVTIGRGCLIGADVTIVDTDFHPIASLARRYAPRGARDSAPVSIGDNVFIGATAIVLKGVSIGANSVIGAGSVVTRSIPAGVIAAGNPCRVVGRLNAGDVASQGHQGPPNVKSPGEYRPARRYAPVE